jgi:hypothetical protein
MTKYSCGHEIEIIIIGYNPISTSAYLEWLATMGRDGNKSQCWACWCKEMNNKK